MVGGLRSQKSCTTDVEKVSSENIEQIINKVCTNLFSQLENRILARFEDIKTQLNDLNESVKRLFRDSDGHAKAVEKLESDVDIIQQQSRKNTLRIYGFPENERENLAADLTKFLSDKLEIECNEEDVDYIFRTGRSLQNKPKPIVVNFIRNIKKNEVFQRKKKLKGSPVSIHEDLTKWRLGLLSKAKEKYGNKNAWSSNGNIYVLRNNNRVLITSVDDI